MPIKNEDEIEQLELDDIYDSNELKVPEDFFLAKSWIKYTFRKE